MKKQDPRPAFSVPATIVAHFSQVCAGRMLRRRVHAEAAHVPLFAKRAMKSTAEENWGSAGPTPGALGSRGHCFLSFSILGELNVWTSFQFGQGRGATRWGRREANHEVPRALRLWFPRSLFAT